MTIVFAAAFVAAVIDWWSVHNEQQSVEFVAKPLVMAILLAAALSAGTSTTSLLVAGGLTCSLAGDVLLLPRINRFVEGLAAFLVAHVFYIGAFLQSAGAPNATGALVGLAVSVILVARIGPQIMVGAHQQDPRLRWPVRAYIAALSIMLMAGVSTHTLTAGIGAVLFAISDAVLGWNRFAVPLRLGRLLTHIPYHLGQGLIALWAVSLS